jgi:hypothetical protein
MAIIEAVDEMEIAGSAATSANRQLACQACFRSGCEGGGLFVPHSNPPQSLAYTHRIANSIERIARHAIDSSHARGCQNFRTQLCNIPCHCRQLPLPAQQKRLASFLLPAGRGSSL